MDLASQRVVESIQYWLDSNKHHSLKLLSDKTRLGYSTVRHIMQRERPVSLQTALLLLAEVCKREDAIDIISEQWPEYGEALQQYFSGNTSEGLSAKDFDQLDELDWRLHSLCKVPQTDEVIRENLGARGLERAGELVDLNLLSYSNHLFQSPDITVTDIRRIASLVELSTGVLMSQRNYDKTALFCFADRTDATGMKTIRDALLEFSRRVRSVLGRGDIPVNISAVAGSIDVHSK